MQIVIDIDDEIAQGIIEGYDDEPRNIVRSFQATIANAIKNGIPLPKEHGDLKDADEILKAMNTWDKFGYTETGCFVIGPKNDYVPYVYYEDMVKAVSDTPIIIEAEEE